MNDDAYTDRTFAANPPDDFFRHIDIQLLVHDMKGPLGLIEANTRMLLRHELGGGQLSPSQRRALERSLRSSAKLHNIVHGLLEVGSCQAGRICLGDFQLVPTAVEILVDELETLTIGLSEAPASAAASTLQGHLAHLRANDIAVVFTPDLEGTAIRQDKRRFVHMLGNLFRNALHFRTSRVTVEITSADAHLNIRVCDDGSGITAEMQGDLFKSHLQLTPACQREHGKGHGFGLAASRILARSLGGDITLDDCYTDGAAFVLRLPMVFDEKRAAR